MQAVSYFSFESQWIESVREGWVAKLHKVAVWHIVKETLGLWKPLMAPGNQTFSFEQQEKLWFNTKNIECWEPFISWVQRFLGWCLNFPRVQYCYTVWIQDQFNNHKVPRKLKLSYNDMFLTIKLEKSSWSAALPISQMYDSMQVSPANCWNSKME